MLIDGQKYACDACIRGHRVSHCQHQDRELHKVAPKGRPVSQCPHCRGARKARAQHVACNCAEKGHSEAECPQKKGEKGEPHTCCCSHGARCGCSLKKDHHRKDQQPHHLDTVPEDCISEIPTPDSFDIKPARSTMSTPSEGSKMTVFANGHHKPVHKHNDAAHTRGLPYTIPRAHSNSELAQRSVDSLPATKRSLISHETPHHHGSVTSAPQPVRRVKSQPGSPGLRGSRTSLAPINTASPALDNAYSPFGTFSGGNSPCTSGFPFTASDPPPESYFGYPSSNADNDSSLPSAGIHPPPPPVDWSSLGVQPYNNASDYSVAPSQPSLASYDYNHDFNHVSHPGLTSSSGELSEAEDYPTTTESVSYAGITMPADPTSKYEEHSYGGGFDTTESYRLSSTSSMMSFPSHSNAMNILKQENVEGMDIDEFLRQAEEQTQNEVKRRAHASSISSNINSIPTPPRSVPTPPTTTLPPQIPLHGLTVREAQNYAHQPGNDSPNLIGDGNLGSCCGGGGATVNGTEQYPGQVQHQPQQFGLMNNRGEDPMWSNPDIMNSPEEVRWDS